MLPVRESKRHHRQSKKWQRLWCPLLAGSCLLKPAAPGRVAVTREWQLLTEKVAFPEPPQQWPIKTPFLRLAT